MDLIDLYHRRGVSLVRSKLARTPAARRGYMRLTKRYAEQIEQIRGARGPVEATELTPAL